MSRRTVYQGRKISLVIETVPLPDGGSVEKEIVLHPGAAVMIPLLAADQVCLVRNRRIAIGATLLELPAGTLDPGENPEAAARRELEEETGYRAGRCRHLADFYPSPGVLAERMHLFLLEDLSKGKQQLDAGEEIEPVVLPWSEAVQMALDGRIQDGKTLAGLLLWDRLRAS